MDIHSVPQDNSSTYSKHKKAIYAMDESGKIIAVESSGWSAEEIVTKQALFELKERSREAFELVKKKEKSPLYYYMYAARMDLQLLSESTGFFKWTIKRDFNVRGYNKISLKRLCVYAEVLGKMPEEIRELPKVFHAEL